jgi:hypothetical protein
VEVVPGNYGANVHEAAKVEKNVDARIDFVVAGFGFGEEAPVPI